MNAIFKIVLTGERSFSDSFWNQTRVWTDIFKSLDGSTILTDRAAVFSGGFQYADNGQSVAPTSQGYFTTSGNSLTWSAVPEPSNLLAGMRLVSALLRRLRDGEVRFRALVEGSMEPLKSEPLRPARKNRREAVNGALTFCRLSAWGHSVPTFRSRAHGGQNVRLPTACRMHALPACRADAP
jgi:hypothetical protein